MRSHIESESPFSSEITTSIFLDINLSWVYKDRRASEWKIHTEYRSTTEMASRPSLPDVLSHVQELLEAFTAFDSDDDGLVPAAELGGILSSMGYNARQAEVKSMMGEADVDGDGQLSLEKFLEMSLKDADLGSLAGLLRSALEMLDAAADDGGDEIDGVRLFELVSSGVTKEECEALIRALDVDGDGTVSLGDFKTIANALL